jgi:hypothetical protein
MLKQERLESERGERDS